MELLHRCSGLKQRHDRRANWRLDEGLVSRDLRAIRQKIQTEPKIQKWFQDLTRLGTYCRSRFEPQREAFPHDSDIARVQEWLGHENGSTTRL